MREGAEDLSRIKDGAETKDPSNRMVGERSMGGEVVLEETVERIEVRMSV